MSDDVIGGVFSNCAPLAGFHETEQDREGAFVWTRAAFEIDCGQGPRHLFLRLERPDAPVQALAEDDGGWRQSLDIDRGWADYTIALPAGAQRVRLRIERPFAAPGDGRELGVRLRSAVCAEDAPRLASLERQAARRANRILNDSEYLAGARLLASAPPQLRLTLETRCNIANEAPCVYCSWDWAKKAETGSPAFDLAFLEGLGRFLELATEVNDCSYGEPTLHPDFPALAERLSADGRLFNLTSNGQTLAPKIRQALLGREIILYVSIDAATAAGYARLRNGRFDELLERLRALCREKRAHGNKPLVTVSCIVMRSNQAELPAFIRLLREVGVDRIYFRALWPEDNLAARRAVHGGVSFDYDAELLDFEELLALSPGIRAAAAAAGQAAAIEWENILGDFAGPAGAPLCSEPWHTLYLLNRGVMPCAFARRPLATWDQRGGQSPEAFAQAVFNGPEYAHIRGELARGRFPDYCRQTPNCPLVRRSLSGRSAV